MKNGISNGFSNSSLPGCFTKAVGNNNLISESLSADITKLVKEYDFIRAGVYGKSIMGKNLEYFVIGCGEHRVIYNASHHGNEWITSSLLMRFAGDYAAAIRNGGKIFGMDASAIWRHATIYIVPMVNPDGVDLASGALNNGTFHDAAADMARQRPDIPFPGGWKANIEGIDTNLQYPAGWDTAKKIKAGQGVSRPGPRDFVGNCPLEAPESHALWKLTKKINPRLTLSYHSQGELIYWKYLDIEPPGSRELATEFARVSGYEAQETPYASGFAGYKDWFIDEYRRPGFTIEVGMGENPLPDSQLETIYADNLGILVLAALGAR